MHLSIETCKILRKKEVHKRIQLKLLTSFSGEIIPPREVNESSICSRIAQRTQKSSSSPANLQFLNNHSKTKCYKQREHIGSDRDLTVTRHIMIGRPKTLHKWSSMSEALQDCVYKTSIAQICKSRTLQNSEHNQNQNPKAPLNQKDNANYN